jgi:hypothetical protein
LNVEDVCGVVRSGQAASAPGGGRRLLDNPALSGRRGAAERPVKMKGRVGHEMQQHAETIKGRPRNKQKQNQKMNNNARKTK